MMIEHVFGRVVGMDTALATLGMLDRLLTDFGAVELATLDGAELGRSRSRWGGGSTG